MNAHARGASWKPKSAILVVMLLLSGCAQDQSVRVIDGCSWVKAITPTEQDFDAASTTLLAQILIHNELVEVNCG